MVRSCVAYNCTNKADKKRKELGIRFFRFPQNLQKRNAWIRAVSRKSWMPTDASYLCSLHFVGGCHSDLPNQVNYAPTIFSHKATQPPSEASLAREKRRENRISFVKGQEDLYFSNEEHNYFSREEKDCDGSEDGTLEISVPSSDIGSQCNLMRKDDIENLNGKVSHLREKLKRAVWSSEKIEGDDVETRYHTGIPTYAVFLWLFNFLKPKAERMAYWYGQQKRSERQRERKDDSTSLGLIDQFFAVLLRLRQGVSVHIVSQMFGISDSTFSRYFSTWVCLLYEELKVLNPFPSKALILQHMPDSFKAKYPSVRVILDCTEVFVQRPSSLLNQSLLFSNYKHHTTIKFLVGITPSGVISFVSHGWGGKVSDRQITNESGILDLLQEGDSVMADKGFTIRDLLEQRKCTLNIPPFLGPTGQFTTSQVYETREIAQLGIHVERSIGRVKRFQILQGVLPLTLAPLASQIFQVCCWLTNLDVPLVS